MKRALVLGAGGFIGSHMVERLKHNGYWVRAVDRKLPQYSPSSADEWITGDLTQSEVCHRVVTGNIDEIYQLAADMGGAGYIFTGDNDVDIMRNSAAINLNIVSQIIEKSIPKVFYSSSACVYPEYNQMDPDNPVCAEHSAYPAKPDSEYGWEKLFGERLYLALMKNYGTKVHIARYHNIFGPKGAWQGGREKAPAAICRKVAEATNGSYIKIWGDGAQTRSFLYITECLDATLQLMNSAVSGPINIGSEECVTVNELAQMVIDISGKQLDIVNIPGPQGVRGRTSDNTMIRERLGWDATQTLRQGLELTYQWVAQQVERTNGV